MANKQIREAIECWASRPTWFSPHPSDAAFFREAVANLRSINSQPTVDELAAAIYEQVSGLSVMLGTPTDLEFSSRIFAERMLSKL